jgi:hypothetical protein
MLLGGVLQLLWASLSSTPFRRRSSLPMIIVANLGEEVPILLVHIIHPRPPHSKLVPTPW